MTDSDRFPVVGGRGCESIRLWSREWGGAWNVTVRWEGKGEDGDGDAGSGGSGSSGHGVGTGLDGRVVCLWSDANDEDAIPAYKEVRRFMPKWSVVSKAGDGLVEGFKVFKV